MFLWANLHGAFIAGFYAVVDVRCRVCLGALDRKASRWSERLWVSWLVVGGLSGLVTLINPAGLKLWTTSVGYLGTITWSTTRRSISSPDFHDASTWPFLLMLLLGLALAGIAGRRWKMTDALVLTGWAAMGLYSVRNAPLFAVAAAPLLAAAGAGWLHDLGKRLRWASRLQRLDERLLATESRLPGLLWPCAGVVLVTAGLSSGARLDFAQTGNRFDPDVFPVAAVDWLEENPQQGEMFNYFPWGGYLLYREWPERRVFIDGQTDFYGADLTREYERGLTGSGWMGGGAGYICGRMGDHAAGYPFGRGASDHSDWQEIYRDETAVFSGGDDPGGAS